MRCTGFGDGRASQTGRVTFGSTVIQYTVTRSRRRRKTVQIVLDEGEGVIVAAPLDTPCDQIQRIVAKRAGWIVRKASAAVLQPRRKRFISGESLPYLGRQARLFVEHADVRHTVVLFTHWSFQVRAPARLTAIERRPSIETAIVAWYRQRALARLTDRTALWSARLGCLPPGVLVRDQRQRWASCAPDGTLRFNWRIIMAPPALIDYVVAHELAHLHTHNHSANFWAELSRVMPDYRLRRARLKELGPSLTL